MPLGRIRYQNRKELRMGYLNHEGYPDPTAHYGIKEVVKNDEYRNSIL